ncbi:MAG: argininosuccinate lyase [Candidatus Acidiferrales bacterium]|jgi:argininosuccinate lyase
MTERKDDKLWGGRFDREPDKVFYEFQRSFSFDRRLLSYEIAVDCAWAKGLAAAHLLTREEAEEILAGLKAIVVRAASDPAWLDGSDAEDVHHFVEAALVERLGPLGWKLHTGRSRNELVAADFRLFVKDAATGQERRVSALVEALAEQAERNLGVPMAGLTHMQHAQPILLSHFLLAHAESFLRDLIRLRAAAASADACPLGSGAFAGAAFPIDRNLLARELGFSRITANSLDAVSDRDFALDYLFALAGISTHLSRLAEDMILFASQEFGYVSLPDEYTTGSSLMPQKKNPDSWELIRGKTGRIVGALTGLLVTLKGLPSSYQRDLQEDKLPLFAAHDDVAAMLAVAAGAVAETVFRAERLRAVAASDPGLLATELADALVRRGVPFRQAHDAVGKILRDAEKQGRAWTELSLEELRRSGPELDATARAEITLEGALARRAVPGGTAPETVREALDDLRRRLRQVEAPA